MKILIVEDESKTATFVKRGFTEEGFVADAYLIKPFSFCDSGS